MHEGRVRMAKVTENVQAILKPILAKKGFDLWNVLYEKQDSDFVLRVLVDRVDGEINMDDLVMLTEVISDELDMITPDPFPQAYLLDVSSPGADRELQQPGNFVWAVGKFIEVILNNPVAGLEKFTGQLVSFLDDKLTIDVALKTKHQLIEIDLDNIQKANLSVSQDRILTTEEDYEWARHKLVHISTYQKINGRKEFLGELNNFTPEDLIITDESNDELLIPRRAVAQARQSNDF